MPYNFGYKHYDWNSPLGPNESNDLESGLLILTGCRGQSLLGYVLLLANSYLDPNLMPIGSETWP